MIRRGFGLDCLTLTGSGVLRALHFESRELFGSYKIPEQVLIALQIFAILHHPISYPSIASWPARRRYSPQRVYLEEPNLDLR